MSKGWKDYKIGEIGKVITGKTPSTSNADYWNGNIPFITPSDFDNKKWINETIRRVSAKAIAEHKNTVLPPNTVMVTCIGSDMGKSAINATQCITNQQINSIIVNDEYFDFEYIHYCLSIRQKELKSICSGSAVPILNKTNFSNVTIACPPLSIQKKIKSFLSVLDERIELLKETNLTLESIAQAIFKSWFVDFDPVYAKQQGIECAGIDKATAGLFPNSFVESELGLIPKDWEVASIKDICEVITNGGTPSRSNALFWENGTIPWYKTGELTDSFLINHSENITQLGLEKSSVKLMEKDSVLMAIYAAPTVGRLGILNQASTFNQATTGMKAKQEIGFVFLYLTLLFGRAWFNNRANGAAQQNISKAIVENYKFVLPTTNILTSFNNSLMPIFKKIEQNINQIDSLSNLRDTLLPRLISGKLDVSNIEDELEGIA